jgi:hypothetical protein
VARKGERVKRHGKHRGTYELRPIVYSTGGILLHIPRREFLASKTVIVEPSGKLTILPWLATYHGRRA